VLKVVVRRWFAWAPGIETAERWSAWAAAPRALEPLGHPEARFLPAMLRRRCTPLTRIMLTAAFGCCGEESLAAVRTVFASRHGSINESIGLLESIAVNGRVSAATFSHTVHNAQAGLFSIAAGNRNASSSIAAQEDTFAAAFLEALTFLERDPKQPVLLVMGDVPLAETFAPLIDEPASSYGVALLLTAAGGGEGVSLRLGRRSDAADRRKTSWPDAIEFLRWHLSSEPDLNLTTPRRCWTFSR
jgi:hypothetical protein